MAQWEETGDSDYIQTHLSVCPSALQIVMVNVILTRNHLSHSLNRSVGSAGHN